MTNDTRKAPWRISGEQAWRLVETPVAKREVRDFGQNASTTIKDSDEDGYDPYLNFEVFLLGCRVYIASLTTAQASWNFDFGLIVKEQLGPEADQNLITFINYHVMAAGLALYHEPDAAEDVVELSIQAGQQAGSSPTLPPHRRLPVMTTVAMLSEEMAKRTGHDDHLMAAIEAADQALQVLPKNSKQPPERALFKSMSRMAGELRFRRAYLAGSHQMMRDALPHLDAYYSLTGKVRDARGSLRALMALAEANHSLAGDMDDAPILRLHHAAAYYSAAIEIASSQTCHEALLVRKDAPEALFRVHRVLMTLEVLQASAGAPEDETVEAISIADLINVFSSPLPDDAADDTGALDKAEVPLDNGSQLEGHRADTSRAIG